MKLLFAYLLSLSVLLCQDVTSILNNVQTILAPPAQTVLTITASQGDGTICTIKKVSGSSVNAILACSNSQITYNQLTLRAAGTNANSTIWGLGDVLCILGINPTNTAITMGSLGSISINSVGWSCSTNIRTSSIVTGQTSIVSGSVSWP